MDDIRPPIPPDSTRFTHLLRRHMRDRGYAYNTEKTYIHWIKYFIRFHGNKHPKKLLDHSDVRTTETYTHVPGRGAMGVISPLDS